MEVAAAIGNMRRLLHLIYATGTTKPGQSIHLESSKQILHMEDSESPVFKNVHEFKEFIRTNYKAPTSKSPVLNGQVMKLVLDGNQKKLSTITDKLFPLLNYKSSRNICFPIRCLLKRIRAYYALPRYSEALWKLMESPFPSGGRGVARKSRDSLVDTSSLSTESSENGFQIAGKRLRSRSKEEPQKVQEQPSLPLNKNKARTRKQLDESPQPPNPDEEKSSHAQKPDT
ncbi:unnamed protein product [Calicophoron daubneyi]|uniref:Uncharacterized protein n=1 Tax=Calicophoron daubneyi TaxID=300641 RepID=A0AAV2TBI1_CALDB